MPKHDQKEQVQNDEWRGYIQELSDWQEADLDQRQEAREADRFLLDKDGQWEDSIRRQIDSQNRPRYTFDKITPVLESIMADIEDMDFGCVVKPAGGGSDRDTAKTFAGMIRSIEAMSKATSIYRKSARRIIRRGFDAWRVKADYSDDWSFEQDLFIEQIPNAINRVWTSPSCANEDSSDTPAAYVLTALSPSEYEKKFPNGKAISVSDADIDEHYDEYRPEVVIIAERFYPKEKMIEIAQMSNGAVYEVDDKFEQVSDELLQTGIRVVRKKKIKDIQWCNITFDGGGMLTEEKETVFRTCPIVTVYGNHELLGQNNKITYSGIVLKNMDAQRVHNYAKSREIEEGALAPRKKKWMTKEQAAGHTNQLSRMNTSADPVQFYNHIDGQPAPFETGGAEVNQHLSVVGNQMAQDINSQSSVFSAMQGDFAGRMSEDAIRMQIDRGTASTRKWVNSIVNGIQRTCEILVQTIPFTYDTKRSFELVNEDGTEEETVLNNEVYDTQTESMVKLNNLNLGKYKVVCDAGPAFSNKLEAGLNALMEYAKVDPNIVVEGGDVILKSIDAPLIDKIAERKRESMLMQGMIPESQMTEEEKQSLAAIQQSQPQQPDPNMVVAEAELMKGQAALQGEQNDANKLAIDQYNAETKRMDALIKAEEAGASINNKNADTESKKIQALREIYTQ